MRVIKSFCVILSLVVCFSVSAQEKPNEEQLKIQKTLRDLFETFTTRDVKDIRNLTTPDLIILENGVVWNMDSTLNAINRQRPADWRRANKLDFFQTEISNNMAFVSYNNQADMHANGNDWTVKWLESAVLVKQGKEWRIKMIHSTRLPYPKK